MYCSVIPKTFSLFSECEALKSLVIRVPPVAKSGDTVTLACDYDLEQAALYTIKWYRNDEEFYRFVPKESPPSKAFNTILDIDVDVSNPLSIKIIICIMIYNIYSMLNGFVCHLR